MKILMINVVCGIRSTGRICTDIAEELEKKGHTVKIAYGRENVPSKYSKYAIRIGNQLDTQIHGVRARLLDESGFGSIYSTKIFLKWVEKYDPDIIHLHNLHGYYINIELLFHYIKQSKKKIIWTLHDCWAFTGHCTYYEYVQCNKFTEGCYDCVQKKEYPKSLVDFSKRNWEKKKGIFTDVNDLTLVTPSKWLANEVKRSFLKSYKSIVINNGIDVEVFKPIKSNIKSRYGIEGKKVVLAVAAIWDTRKGLKYVLEMSERLDDSYKVVVIGLSDKQCNELAKSNILAIRQTNDIYELTEWYSSAEVFINPTLEDNYPTTNLESIACGTPVVTFQTGGSSESAEMYGLVVEKEDIDSMYRAVVENSFQRKRNISSKEEMVSSYIELFRLSEGM